MGALKDASTLQQELNLRVQQVERERDEERRVANAEVRRLTDELRAAEGHIERLNRELSAAADRSMRQHEGDRREVNDLVARIKALQNEAESHDNDSHRKVVELAETLRLAEEEIRRLDMELRSRPAILHSPPRPF